MDSNTRVVSIQNDKLNYKNKVQFLMQKFNLEQEFNELMKAKGNIKNDLSTIKEFYGITDLLDLEMIKKITLDEEDALLIFEELDKMGISYDPSEFTTETDNELKTIRNRVVKSRKPRASKDSDNQETNT